MNDSTMFGGLRLRDDFEDGEPRIRDLELAKRLGYERPRDIRRLIDSIQGDGFLNNIHERAATARTPNGGHGQTIREYWLDEIEAVFLIGQSRTPIARAVHLEVATAFVAYRKGKAHVPRLLAEVPCDWSMMWRPSMVAALCRLHGYPYENGVHPHFLASTYDKIYRLIAESEEHKHLKKINPHPRFGSNHHQWFTDPARKALAEHLAVIEDTALLSCSKREFWDRLEAYYYKRPLQLPLVGTGRKLSAGERRANRRENDRGKVRGSGRP